MRPPDFTYPPFRRGKPRISAPAKAVYFLGLLFLLLFIYSNAVFSQDQPPPALQPLPFQQDAPTPQTEEQIALKLYQNQEFDKAAEIYQRIYENKPSLYIYQYYFFCLVEMKEYSRAEKLAKKAQKAESNSLRYQVDLGYIAYRMGNEDKAKKIYGDALEDLTANQNQISELANAFIIRGENDYAIKTYLRGRILMNYSYPFGFEMASVYERMGDFKNAMNEYLNLLDVNATYLTTVQDRIQSALSYDINNEKNESFRKALLGRVQKEPDKTHYAELLWWYSIQQKDFDLALLQARALDRRLSENGDRLIQLASLAIANEKYDVAIESYKYIVSKGPGSPNYRTGRRELTNTRYLMITSEPSPDLRQLEALEKELNEQITGEGMVAENIMVARNLAHLKAFYLDRQQEAIDLLDHILEMPGVLPVDRARCKIELADILIFTDDVWEATLLYQQVYQDYKSDVIGQEAKFKNARLSFYIGEFAWAKAQADVLKAATSKFISNDAIALSLLIGENYDPDSNTVALALYSKADLLDYQNKREEAIRTLDSIPMLFDAHPIFQYVVYKKAEIRRKQGQYLAADSLYAQMEAAFSGQLLADEALMQRALLNEKQLGNTAMAMQLYGELLEKYPASIFVPEARKKYRLLRGDNKPS